MWGDNSKPTKREVENWHNNDYWRVYHGILGLNSKRTPSMKIKSAFRKEHKALVEKYREKLEMWNQ